MATRLNQPGSLLASAPASRSLRWAWVLGSALIGAVLLVTFLAVVDPSLVRTRVDGAVLAATLMLSGIVAGYRSGGRTLWEPGIGGLILVAVASAALAFADPSGLTLDRILVALALGPWLAVVGAWTGEMLQGTYLDPSPRIQWLWVLVAIATGFTTGIYCVYMADAIAAADPFGLAGGFAVSFFVTGAIVGFFSPGRTILEPGIAAVGIVCVDVVFFLAQFHAMFPAVVVLFAAVAGGVLAVAGAWLGEVVQRQRVVGTRG